MNATTVCLACDLRARLCTILLVANHGAARVPTGVGLVFFFSTDQCSRGAAVLGAACTTEVRSLDQFDQRWVICRNRLAKRKQAMKRRGNEIKETRDTQR
ncbi:uncharacterized protein TrAtP1_001086 [Trichoderma atroviride]|uniref:uncharacterized protein n=1 Tax=Hypocrea atroviridis TaxID=63577 RepID=UPI00332FAB94|nr:hypothetical protein TrAtP1_001086 [Trichoderma atroviride]